jgi:hypothetical protein
MVPADVVVVSFTQGFCSILDVDPTEKRNKNSPFGITKEERQSRSRLWCRSTDHIERMLQPTILKVN